jgi:hypothetical protein
VALYRFEAVTDRVCYAAAMAAHQRPPMRRRR